MKIFTFSEARQQFSSVLDLAQQEGGVQITRRDGRVFLIKALDRPTSPLDIKGVQLNVHRSELLDFIHESRPYGTPS
jgi:antitoxin (DNA-binding transcriptional repressor) of toxin-antitoxin stability system